MFLPDSVVTPQSIHRKMGDSRNRSSDEVAEACLETMEVVDTFNRSRAALDRDRSEVVKNGKFSRNEAVRLITNYIDQNQPNTVRWLFLLLCLCAACPPSLNR